MEELSKATDGYQGNGSQKIKTTLEMEDENDKVGQKSKEILLEDLKESKVLEPPFLSPRSSEVDQFLEEDATEGLAFKRRSSTYRYSSKKKPFDSLERKPHNTSFATRKKSTQRSYPSRRSTSSMGFPDTRLDAELKNKEGRRASIPRSSMSIGMSRHPHAKELGESFNTKIRELLMIGAVVVVNILTIILAYGFEDGLTLGLPPDVIRYAGGVVIEILLLLTNILTIMAVDAEAAKLLSPICATGISVDLVYTLSGSTTCLRFDAVDLADRGFPTLETSLGVSELIFASALGCMRSEQDCGGPKSLLIVGPQLNGIVASGDTIDGHGFQNSISANCKCYNISSALPVSRGLLIANEQQDVLAIARNQRTPFLYHGRLQNQTESSVTSVFILGNTLGCGGYSDSLVPICSITMGDLLDVEVISTYLTDGTTASIALTKSETVAVKTDKNTSISNIKFALETMMPRGTSYYFPSTVPGMASPILYWMTADLISLNPTYLSAGMETTIAIMIRSGMQRTFSLTGVMCPRFIPRADMARVFMKSWGYASLYATGVIQLIFSLIGLGLGLSWIWHKHPITPALNALRDPTYFMTLLADSPFSVNLSGTANAPSYVYWQALDLMVKIGESVDTLSEPIGHVKMERAKFHIEPYAEILTKTVGRENDDAAKPELPRPSATFLTRCSSKISMIPPLKAEDDEDGYSSNAPSGDIKVIEENEDEIREGDDMSQEGFCKERKPSDHRTARRPSITILTNMILIWLALIMRKGVTIVIPRTLLQSIGPVLFQLVLIVVNMVTVSALDEAAMILLASKLTTTGYSMAACGFMHKKPILRLSFSNQLSLNSPCRKVLSRAALIWVVLEGVKILSPFGASGISVKTVRETANMVPCILFDSTKIRDQQYPTIESSLGVAEFIFGNALGCLRSQRVCTEEGSLFTLGPQLVGAIKDGDTIMGPGYTAYISSVCECHNISDSTTVEGGLITVQDQRALMTATNEKDVPFSLLTNTMSLMNNGSQLVMRTVHGNVPNCGGFHVEMMPICTTTISKFRNTEVLATFLTDGTTASIALVNSEMTRFEDVQTAQISSIARALSGMMEQGHVYSTPSITPGMMNTLMYWTSSNLISIDPSLYDVGIETHIAILLRAAIQRFFKTKGASCPRRVDSMGSAFVSFETWSSYCILVSAVIQLMFSLFALGLGSTWLFTTTPITPALRALSDPSYFLTLLSDSPFTSNLVGTANAQEHVLWQNLDVVIKIGESVDTIGEPVGRIRMGTKKMVRDLKNAREYC
ncbi:hypothetical protein HDU67_005418 [Dinochytrium kinnereticum]|nr:hypothetical protein HDU67_005418 [Dinochytrium kinnereticum]